MRSALAFIVFTAIALTTPACTDSSSPADPDEVRQATGTIVQKATNFFVLESDSPIGVIQVRTVYPRDLPEAFKKDQLRVRFSGKIEVDPTVMYAFAPLRIFYIERLLP